MGRCSWGSSGSGGVPFDHVHYEAQADDLIPESSQPCQITTVTPPVWGLDIRVARFPEGVPCAGIIRVPVMHDRWDKADIDVNIHSFGIDAPNPGRNNVDMRVGAYNLERGVSTVDHTSPGLQPHLINIPGPWIYTSRNQTTVVTLQGGAVQFDQEGLFVVKLKRYPGGPDSYDFDLYVMAVSIEIDLS